MSNTSGKLEWCIVRLGQDFNWWVEEISDPVAWDVDGLGIVDPKQLSYLLDLLDPLKDYHFQEHFIEEAFYKFKIDRDLGDGRIRLIRSYDALLEAEEPLFVLPDVIDDEKGPYADFLDHISKIRVKLLNDLIDFKKKLTISELEDEIREEQHSHFLEGKAIHPFKEVADILEYVPEGFELDLDNEEVFVEGNDEEEEELPEDELPDFEEEEIEEDETMRWDDEDDDLDNDEVELDDLEDDPHLNEIEDESPKNIKKSNKKA